MSTKVDTSKWVLGKDFYDWNDDISISMLSNGYLLPHENIPLMFKRVSKAAAKRLKRKDLQPYFFEAFEKNWLCGASPVLSNMGTERGLPISCFGIHIEDSIEGIGGANSELMKLSSQGGGVGMFAGDIRPTGAPIKDNGVSEGVIPWLKIYDSTTLATNQGSVRRGATAFWLPIEHKDIHDFLKIRQPKGDPNRQTLNSHHGVVISDEFMEKVENKDPEAIHLWGQLLKTRLEKGEPYIMFEGNTERGKPQAYKNNNLKIKFSNICLTGDSVITIKLNNEIIDIFIDELEYILKYNSDVEVYSYDFETNEEKYFPILNFAMTNPNSEIYLIEDLENNISIKCTPEHLIYTQNRGFVQAKDLNENDKLLIKK